MVTTLPTIPVIGYGPYWPYCIRARGVRRARSAPCQFFQVVTPVEKTDCPHGLGRPLRERGIQFPAGYDNETIVDVRTHY
jgi:hypothetical protein